jgi:adenylate cyclase
MLTAVAAGRGGMPRSRGRSECVGLPRRPARNQHYADRVARQRRVLNITAYIAAFISVLFAVVQLVTGAGLWPVGTLNLAAAAVFVAVPKLHPFGELLAPLVFIGASFFSLSVICWHIGTASGLQFYFVVAATVAVLVLGIDHIALACAAAAVGVGLTIGLQFGVPADTRAQPRWALNLGFVTSVGFSAVIVVATVYYALREISRAEAAMETEYQRSEALLANILPVSIAERLKDPARQVIADKYDDASVLFADIAGYTQWASQTPPTELVRFLDRLYTAVDALVDRHGLEKVKTSGDSYMVVSGVPVPRPDHLEALAHLALEMAAVASKITDSKQRAVPVRIGLAAGPVVAGVVGSRKFFYDVWGDAVNVASRMESTDVEGRIQVPHNVYERLRHGFVFEERGDVDVKGKGVMHTWYLVGRRDGDDIRNPVEHPAAGRAIPSSSS